MTPYDENELYLLTRVLPHISEQLRASMTSIRSGVRRLAPQEAREENAKTDRGAAEVEAGFYRTARLIGNLSLAPELTKEGRFPAKNGDIAAFCRELCEKMEAPFSLCGVTLAFSSDQPHHVIRCNERMLEQLMFNLLSNALRYTPRGGRVDVELRILPNWVNITVRDTGCGIAKEKLDTVFDRFLHPDALDASPHGLGLGLALCRRIAQGHGGRIVAESTEGKGASFTVSLPNTRSSTMVVSERSGVDRYGGFNPVLVALSDALPLDAFSYRYMD